MALLAKSSTRAFSAAARPQRRVAVVVRAQQQQQKPQLPALAKPALVATIANVIAALPAHADSGKVRKRLTIGQSPGTACSVAGLLGRGEKRFASGARRLCMACYGMGGQCALRRVGAGCCTISGAGTAA